MERFQMPEMVAHRGFRNLLLLFTTLLSVVSRMFVNANYSLLGKFIRRACLLKGSLCEID